MSCQLILKGSSPDILSESGPLKPLQISPKCWLLGGSKPGPLGFCVNFPPADQAVGPVLATGQGLPGSLAGHCSVSLESPFPCRVLSVSPTHTGKAFVQMLPCVCTPYAECLPLGGVHTDTPPPPNHHAQVCAGSSVKAHFPKLFTAATSLAAHTVWAHVSFLSSQSKLARAVSVPDHPPHAPCPASSIARTRGKWTARRSPREQPYRECFPFPPTSGAGERDKFGW